MKEARWSVPRMWEGETVAILASGESMSAAVAETVHGRCKTIVINNTWELAPWADMLYGADASWWEKYHPYTRRFSGLKVTASEVKFPDVLQLRYSGKTGEDGFDPDPAFVRKGGNGGFQTIHIAAHAGAKRILLCGYDMHGGHWHGRHTWPLREHGDGIFLEWIRRMGSLVQPLAERGIEIINCTPGSALKCWPFMPLEEALACVVVTA